MKSNIIPKIGYIIIAIFLIYSSLKTYNYVQKTKTVEDNYLEYRKLTSSMTTLVENLSNPNKLFLLKDQADKILPLLEKNKTYLKRRSFDSVLIGFQRLSDTISSNIILNYNEKLREFKSFKFDSTFNNNFHDWTVWQAKIDSLTNLTVQLRNNNSSSMHVNSDSTKSIIRQLSNNIDSISNYYKKEKSLKVDLLKSLSFAKDYNLKLEMQLDSSRKKIENLIQSNTEGYAFMNYGIGVFCYIDMTNKSIIPVRSSPLSAQNIKNIRENDNVRNLIIHIKVGAERNQFQFIIKDFETGTILKKFDLKEDFIILPIKEYLNNKYKITLKSKDQNINFDYMMNLSINK